MNGTAELEYNRVGRARVGLVGVEAEEPEYGEFSLKVCDNKLREWSVSMPYPLEIELDEAHRRLQAALNVLISGSERPARAEAGADA